MQIKLKWLPRAIALLDDIYEYDSEKSERWAIRICNKLLDSAEPLKTFPYAGISEPLLEEFPQNFRSLVVEKHFKLIYTISPTLIEIHAIWDCRQDNWRLKEMFHR